jgi:hypothetical protein
MDENEREPLVRLTVVGDPMTAQVVAAQLRSMGIDPHLRGEGWGPYPVTVGRLAQTEIWVRESDVEDAREVIDHRLDSAEPSGSDETAADSATLRVLALATVIVLALAVGIALMRIG